MQRSLILILDRQIGFAFLTSCIDTDGTENRVIFICFCFVGLLQAVTCTPEEGTKPVGFRFALSGAGDVALEACE